MKYLLLASAVLGYGAFFARQLELCFGKMQPWTRWDEFSKLSTRMKVYAVLMG